MQRVARTINDEVPADGSPDEREIADGVDELVPDRFVDHAELVLWPVGPPDHGVLQGRAAPAPCGEHGADVFGEGERTGMRERTEGGAGNHGGGSTVQRAEVDVHVDLAIVRGEPMRRAAVGLHRDGLGDDEGIDGRSVPGADGEDALPEGLRGAVDDRQLRAVDGDHGIRDSVRDQRGEDVFDGAHDDRTDLQRRGACPGHDRVDADFCAMVAGDEDEAVAKRGGPELDLAVHTGVHALSAPADERSQRTMVHRWSLAASDATIAAPPSLLRPHGFLMRVLGIDPGSTVTGFGVVELDRGRYVHIASGAFKTSSEQPMGERLAIIYKGLVDALAAHRPEAVAIEAIFHHKSSESALRLGQARGVALLAAAQAGHEAVAYNNATVKSTVGAHGRADKDAVAKVVGLLLGHRVEGPADVTDAIAIAMCHLSHLRVAGRIPALRRTA